MKGEFEMSNCTVKISLGALSVEYTGEQSFVEDGLLELIGALAEKAPAASTQAIATTSIPQHTSSAASVGHLSTNTIASQMSSHSGPDLIIAAVAHLQLVKQQDKATRSEISKEMKAATTYYKASFGGNLTSYFNSLVKAKRLNQISQDAYALSATERATMESLMQNA